MDPVTLAVQVSTLSLLKVWSGESDITLRPLDAVTVFSSARLPATVTIAVRLEVYCFSPRSKLERPVPPPIATMRGPCRP